MSVTLGITKLAQFGLLIPLLSAGCGCTGNNKSSTNSDAQIQGSDAETAAPDATLGQQSYANVVGVATTGESGSRRFSVSIESADTGCERYANWWEILRADGSLLYRRILGHSHTDANGTTDPGAPGNTFTRSSTEDVDVSDDEMLFVRAHMNDVGYVGQLMSGSVSMGFVTAQDLGDDFAPGVESESPQPTGCAF